MIPRRKKTTTEAATAVVESLFDGGEKGPGAPPKDAKPAEPPKQVAELERTISDGWRTIIEDVVTIDVDETYQRLRDALSLGDNAHAYGEVAQALDSADRNYFDSILLTRAAKLEEQRVEAKANEVLEVIRSAARSELEAEKKNGERSKAPTIQDVEDRMVASWSETVIGKRREIAELHAARAVTEGLSSAWSSRAQSLRKLLERIAPVGTR